MEPQLRLRPEELARIGAIFDCEGSAGIYLVYGGTKRADGSLYPRYPRPVVQIGMLAEDFLRKELLEKLGFGQLTPIKIKSGKTFWTWKAYSRDAEKFAWLMRDYSLVKIDKLEEIVRFYNPQAIYP